jgi:hypothetical protein
MCPLEAWNEIKHCEHAVKFLGGERNKPRDDHAIVTFALGRALRGRRRLGAQVYPAAYGWIPHNAGFGFLDLTPSILLLRQFWD